ncbi:MAG: hypothetical protein OHK0029_25690 [Armatimonadaceae bacterium]
MKEWNWRSLALEVLLAKKGMETPTRVEAEEMAVALKEVLLPHLELLDQEVREEERERCAAIVSEGFTLPLGQDRPEREGEGSERVHQPHRESVWAVCVAARPPN